MVAMWWKHGILAVTRLEQIEMAEQVRLNAQTWTSGRTAAGKISQLVIRKKWKEGTKTQQQKLSEAFIHLSLQMYHHSLLPQMFSYSLQWAVLSPRPLLSFLADTGMWWCEVIAAASSFVPYLKQFLAFLTCRFVLILLCEQKLGKKTKVFLLKDFE